MPGSIQLSKDTSGKVGSTARNELVQFNRAVTDLTTAQMACSLDALWSWQGVGANSGTAPLIMGSTNTRVGFAKFVVSIAGVPIVVAASAAGTVFGALGTIPASTWGLIALESDGTTMTFTSAAANYTTGYATEALAIAALPARLTVKARVGYVTILASSSTWITGTDALAGGSGGTPATTTNYYPTFGLFSPTGSNVINGWTGGANGVLIATVLSRGSTDTNLASTAFTFSANGLTNIPKAAVAAGTAFGALGTIPASTWGVIVTSIDAAGAITHVSCPKNYTTGYPTMAAAIADVPVVTVPSGKCRMGYTAILASSSGFVVGTDALAGGVSGTPATTTAYFPTAGITLQSGFIAGQIAEMSGTTAITG